MKSNEPVRIAVAYSYSQNNSTQNLKMPRRLFHTVGVNLDENVDADSFTFPFPWGRGPLKKWRLRDRGLIEVYAYDSIGLVWYCRPTVKSKFLKFWLKCRVIEIRKVKIQLHIVVSIDQSNQFIGIGSQNKEKKSNLQKPKRIITETSVIECSATDEH